MPGGGKGGGASSTVTVHNGPVTVDADSTVEVVGLDRMHVTARLEPTPLKTESRQELIVPQPLKTESRLETASEISSDSTSAMSVDLKPVALDVCLNTSAKLPQGQICQPFSFHLGLTMFGVEFFGMNFGGESRTTMQELPRRPAVEWPAQQHAPTAAASPSAVAAGPAPGGLRVRLK